MPHQVRRTARQFVMSACTVDVVLGWTYGLQTTHARRDTLAWLPFPPTVLGWWIVACGIAGMLAIHQHRRIPERRAWACAAAPIQALAVIWALSALMNTPWVETLHVAGALSIFAGTVWVSLRWVRHRTWCMLALIVTALAAAIAVTIHGDISRWSAWSSAVVYAGYAWLLYQGARSSAAVDAALARLARRED